VTGRFKCLLRGRRRAHERELWDIRGQCRRLLGCARRAFIFYFVLLMQEIFERHGGQWSVVVGLSQWMRARGMQLTDSLHSQWTAAMTV
jgi:hypothetical protein